MMSCIKIAANGETIAAIWQYINTSKATEIISGIFLSILIAFSVGAFVMYISRLIFTFHYQEKMRAFGAIFGGVVLKGLGYFIVILGLNINPIYGILDDYLNNTSMLIYLYILFVI